MFILITDDENIPHLINKNHIVEITLNNDKTKSIIILTSGDWVYSNLTIVDLNGLLNN